MKNIDVSQFDAEGYQVFESVIPPDIILEVREFLSQRIEETLDPAKREVGIALDNDVVLRLVKLLGAIGVVWIA